METITQERWMAQKDATERGVAVTTTDGATLIAWVETVDTDDAAAIALVPEMLGLLHRIAESGQAWSYDARQLLAEVSHADS